MQASKRLPSTRLSRDWAVASPPCGCSQSFPEKRTATRRPSPPGRQPAQDSTTFALVAFMPCCHLGSTNLLSFRLTADAQRIKTFSQSMAATAARSGGGKKTVPVRAAALHVASDINKVSLAATTALR